MNIPEGKGQMELLLMMQFFLLNKNYHLSFEIWFRWVLLGLTKTIIYSLTCKHDM